MLDRLQQSGEKLQITLHMTSEKTANDVTARDNVFEITGSLHPEEIVLLSGHWDSWDVGTGAMDDGGGCAAAWAALKAMKELGLRPQRTIRVVFWGSEERGPGGQFYHDVHRSWQNETWRFVSESDEGAFRGRSRRNSSLSFYGSEAGYQGLSMSELVSLAGDVAEAKGVFFGIAQGPGWPQVLLHELMPDWLTQQHALGGVDSQLCLCMCMVYACACAWNQAQPTPKLFKFQDK